MSVPYSGYGFLSVFQKAPARIPEPCLPPHSQFCYLRNLPSVLLSIPPRFHPISENGHLPSTDLLPEWTDRKYSFCFRYTRFSTDLLSCGWKSIFLFPGQTRLSSVYFPKKWLTYRLLLSVHLFLNRSCRHSFNQTFRCKHRKYNNRKDIDYSICG